MHEGENYMRRIFFGLLLIANITASHEVEEFDRKNNRPIDVTHEHFMKNNEEIHPSSIDNQIDNQIDSTARNKIRKNLIEDTERNEMDLIYYRWAWRKAANIFKGMATVCLAGNVICSSLALPIGSLGDDHKDTAKIMQIVSSGFLATYAGLRLIAKYAANEAQERQRLLQIVANRIGFHVDDLIPKEQEKQ